MFDAPVVAVGRGKRGLRRTEKVRDGGPWREWSEDVWRGHYTIRALGCVVCVRVWVWVWRSFRECAVFRELCAGKIGYRCNGGFKHSSHLLPLCERSPLLLKGEHTPRTTRKNLEKKLYEIVGL